MTSKDKLRGSRGRRQHGGVTGEMRDESEGNTAKNREINRGNEAEELKV